MPSIAVADSSPVFRYGMVNIIRQLDDVELVGEACSTVELLGLVEAFHPDLVIIDFLAEGFSVDAVVACVDEELLDLEVDAELRSEWHQHLEQTSHGLDVGGKLAVVGEPRFVVEIGA